MEKAEGDAEDRNIGGQPLASSTTVLSHKGTSAFVLKGVPVGTALVILMSITAISLPEIMMLKKVLSWKLIGLFLGYLIIAFIVVGYLLNWIL